jgi:hypothetical protein
LIVMERVRIEGSAAPRLLGRRLAIGRVVIGIRPGEELARGLVVKEMSA